MTLFNALVVRFAAPLAFFLPGHPMSRARMARGATSLRSLVGLSVCGWLFAIHAVAAQPKKPAPPSPKVVDLSLLVAPNYPCVWPIGMTPYHLTPQRVIGPGGYNRDFILMDEHTGTQWDAPAHFIPPLSSGLSNAGPMGAITGEKVPVWQFVGEACVVDLREHLDDAEPGHSFLITPELVRAWEKKYRPLGPGDVVLFRSDYSDRYYKPFPEGERFVQTVLEKTTPGWPAPTPDCMKYLAERKVAAAGLDSPSMGPVPLLAAATHIMGAQHGMIWTEGLVNLGALPATGALYALLPAKHAGGSGGEARVLAITEPKLASQLLGRARAKNVADLSVVLDENYPITWPGEKPGSEANRYLKKTLNFFSETRGPYFACTHIMDSHVGTHLVPPAYALPPKNFQKRRYALELRQWLQAYESIFGPLGSSDKTAEKVPLDQCLGPARVIDVRHLQGSTPEKNWPASPAITLEHIKREEQDGGPIVAGQVVIFHSGYSDRHLRPFPEGKAMFEDPLAGKSEGWPAPTPEVIVYLAARGVRCIGTDGPTLGGVELKRAQMVYWALGSRGLCAVEYLTNIREIVGRKAYFLFAPIRLQGNHGGHGRAIALYE